MNADLLNWVENCDYSYLKVADPLCPTGVQIGFSGTRFYDLSDSKKLLSAFSISNVLTLNQVHGVDIRNVGKNKNISQPIKITADGWYINQPFPDLVGQMFTIRTADCLPIVLIGKDSISLIHAGWRGLELGIVKEALDIAKNQDHTFDLAIIGPAADPTLYEVGQEVAFKFSKDAIKKAAIEGKYLLNLYSAAENMLLKAGFNGQIINSPIYTISDNRFHSFRRDRDQAGRNISFVAFTT